jgi:hypothetical protein
MLSGRGRPRAAWGAMVLVFGLLGCARPGVERYIPSDDAARRALETVLTNLQRGQSPDEGTTAPVIHLVDSRWKPGEQLAKYEITKEESVEGHTMFSVLLVLKGGKREKLVRYVVVGRDPLYVYREEDFHSAGGM